MYKMAEYAVANPVRQEMISKTSVRYERNLRLKKEYNTKRNRFINCSGSYLF